MMVFDIHHILKSREVADGQHRLVSAANVYEKIMAAKKIERCRNPLRNIDELDLDRPARLSMWSLEELPP